MLGLPPGCGTMKSMLGDGVGTQSVMAMSPTVTRQYGALHAPTGERLTCQTPTTAGSIATTYAVDELSVTLVGTGVKARLESGDGCLTEPNANTGDGVVQLVSPATGFGTTTIEEPVNVAPFGKTLAPMRM